MKKKMLRLLVLCCLTSLVACSQTEENPSQLTATEPAPQPEYVKVIPHNYGGWYCPDNLIGFPAVDIADWKKVPVVSGRLPTKEETRTGKSLIYVDQAEYPDAKPLDMEMPRLAWYYNENAEREDLVIVIQAINVVNDSVVGFRFINGGNGSAWLNEVRLLSDTEIDKIPKARFVSRTEKLNAGYDKVWKVLTRPEYTQELQQILDKGNPMTTYTAQEPNVNFRYANAGSPTAAFRGEVFGNFYIQNDYENLNYTEKFLLLSDSESNTTTLYIATGPYGNDFESREAAMQNWVRRVRELSEKQ